MFGYGYIYEIFNDGYKIKLLHKYNHKAGMNCRADRRFQLNKKSERIRYIQFLNYNINYIDSVQQVEPKKWDDELRYYKNELDGYKKEDYICIGNQFLHIYDYGKIRIRIDKIKEDYGIATLVEKEYHWIKIEKEDKIIFK